MNVEPISNSKLVREYLELMAPSWSKHRRETAFLKVLDVFLRCSGFKSIEGAVSNYRKSSNGLSKVLMLVISELQKQELKPKTILSYLILLKKFLEFYDVPVAPEWRKVKKPKKSTIRLDRLPSLSVIQKLILMPKSPRMRVLLQLLAQTGMRIGEALQLKVSYIDFENNIIRLPGNITKTGQPREIPLHPELKEALQSYLRTRNMKSEYLFPSKRGNKPWAIGWVRVRYHEILRRYGLDDRTSDGSAYAYHFHVFRKWFRSRCEAIGINAVMLDRWLGHGEGIRHTYTLFDQETLKRETEKMFEAVKILGVTETVSPDMTQRLQAAEEAINFYEKLLEHINKKNPRLLRELGLE